MRGIDVTREKVKTRKVPKIRHFFSYVAMRWAKPKGFCLSSGTSLVSFSDTAISDLLKAPDPM